MVSKIVHVEEKKIQVMGQVPRVNGRELSYGQFWEQYMNANKPVLLTGLMDSWRACQDWVLETGTPNLAFILQHFGISLVQVADCGSREFTDQKRLDMTVVEFVKYWKALQAGDELPSEMDQRHLYLKDWHFVKEYPDYHAYTTPEFFEDDWLNWYLDHNQLHASGEDAQGGDKCSDYRFVYMGPKGTWTPLHADVLRSYSWSSNVCGRKLWHLLPADQTPMIYDRHQKHTVYDIHADVSELQFPEFSKARWMECVQGPGEILFVPSGWFHQVRNMEDTISINHNWLNACNLQWNWKLLHSDYRETVESIEDIRTIADDFEALCQRNLAANSGMNFVDFFKFIVCNLQRDIGAFTELSTSPTRDLEHHTDVVRAYERAWFNLQKIRSILVEMATQDYFLLEERSNKYQELSNLQSPKLAISFIDTMLETCTPASTFLRSSESELLANRLWRNIE